jgi:hypothetical protein
VLPHGVDVFIDDNPVNPVGLVMEVFKAELVADKQKDQQAAGNAHSQTRDVDKGIDLVLFNVPQSRFNIVFKHE